LTIGVVCTAAFPFLMTRRPHPLVPLGLFRSRNFTVTNISTLVIYGALYVMSYYQAIFVQGTLGYTAAAAGLTGIPATIFLAVLSARFGALAGRYGPRWFMVIGPAVMALGVLWLTRIPATSAAWALRIDDPHTFVPPLSWVVDILPATIVFGLGLSVMVAPLTTALMTSVPVHNSGIASAINNAISRIGPQLAGALIFVGITALFYASLAAHGTGLNLSSQQVREKVSPLNRPAITVSGPQAAAIRDSSAEAFHLAMLVCAGLLAAGALVNAAGIRNRVAPAPEAQPEPQAQTA
jgi:hypothetical protein